MTHRIKITDERYENISRGLKKAEIRYNDRDYQKDDVLQFMDEDGLNERTDALYKVSHIHSGLGLAEGYVCLSITHLSHKPPIKE